MKTIIVLEDSSRVGFGGGQKITLTVCDILKEYITFKFVDFSDKTRFAEEVKMSYPTADFINLNQYRGSITTNRLISWPISVFYFLAHLNDGLKKIIGSDDTKQMIVYATNKRTLLYAYSLNKKFDIPYIYHAHMVERKSQLLSLILKHLLKKATTVLCVSNTVLKSVNANNKQLLYNPSSNEKGYKGVKKDCRFVIAMIGSLIPIKGIEYFIDAAKACPPDIEFRVYGDGPLRHKLKSYAEERVRFMGFCKDVIAELYGEIDVVVVATTIPEALSLSVVDAKSVGIPIIVTTPGGQSEIVRDGIDGFHVSMKDSNAIADYVKKLTTDLDLYNKMGKASYESFHSFEYNGFKKNILNIFNITQ